MPTMVIRYGGQEFKLDDIEFTLPELAAVQRHTGLLATEFEAGVKDPKGNALALLGVLWLARRRSGDLVKWADFEASLTAPLAELEVDVLDDAPAASGGDPTADAGIGKDAFEVVASK